MGINVGAVVWCRTVVGASVVRAVFVWEVGGIMVVVVTDCCCS